MEYVAKNVNGRAVRDKFVRSMDISANRSPEDAFAAYSETWFSSTRKQYLNEAFKYVLASEDGRRGSPGQAPTHSEPRFWPMRAVQDMLDEILVDYDGPETGFKALARDVDRLKGLYSKWYAGRNARGSGSSVSDADMALRIKEFEARYRYRCPDTFKSCWMNRGAYKTIAYGIKYEGLRFNGCPSPEESLNVLNEIAFKVMAEMDHDVDDKLFRACHALYLQRLEKSEKQVCRMPDTARAAVSV